MHKAWLLLGLMAAAGCSHAERGGTAGENVPRSQAVTTNAQPTDMPPLSTPIPKTASSVPNPRSEPTDQRVQINPTPLAPGQKTRKRSGRTAPPVQDSFGQQLQPSAPPPAPMP